MGLSVKGSSWELLGFCFVLRNLRWKTAFLVQGLQRIGARLGDLVTVDPERCGRWGGSLSAELPLITLAVHVGQIPLPTWSSYL